MEIACVAELWSSYERQGARSGYSFLVHRNGEEMVGGYACYGPHPLTEGTFDLYWIAVDPELRGRGIAHELLARVEEEVCKLGGRLVVVETSSTEAYGPARRFYEACGYRQEAIVRGFYGRGDDLVICTKELASAEMHSVACALPLSTELLVGAEPAAQHAASPPTS